MEPTASKKPPGRLLFPRQRSSTLRWFLPALLLHLLVLIVVVATTRPGVRVARPLPRWAIALGAPQVNEPLFLLLPPPPAALPAPPLARAVERVAAVAPGSGPPSPSAAPTERPTPDVSAGGAAGPTPTAPRGPTSPVVVGPRRPVAERLKPGQGDPRLYAPLPEEIVGLSADQLAQLDLDLAIAEVVDSIEAAEAAGRRATDWTYTDSQGRRWGVAPGANGMVNLYVGGLTIPLPFGFSAPRTADAGLRARQDAEIAAQAGRATATAVLKDRAQEIRRRRDAERARARARVQADTTGGE